MIAFNILPKTEMAEAAEILQGIDKYIYPTKLI